MLNISQCRRWKVVLRETGGLAAAILTGAGLWVAGLSPTRAESDSASPMQFLLQENARAAQPAAPAAARAPAVHHAAPTFRRVLMQRATAEPRQRATVATVPATPPAAPPTTVAVYGDRLAQALTSGLQEESGRALAVSANVNEDAGLTRTDFGPWLQSVRDRLEKPDHASVAVIMVGSNDREPLPDQGTSVGPETPRWQELYGTRVEAVADAFRQALVPLIWVGLPTVRSEETSAEFVRLNGIFRDRAARGGATYVDSWEVFSDDAGRYSPVGPDVQGQTVKLRKADGFGFTRAGARKLASFVETDIKRLHLPTAPLAPIQMAAIHIEKAPDFDQALDVDVNALIRREAGLSPEAAPPAPRPLEPAKPAAGPVISLTAPPLSPDGHLASLSGAGPGSTNPVQASLVIRPPDSGPAIIPQSGRADDFSWPKR